MTNGGEPLRTFCARSIGAVGALRRGAGEASMVLTSSLLVPSSAPWLPAVPESLARYTVQIVVEARTQPPACESCGGLDDELVMVRRVYLRPVGTADERADATDLDDAAG